VGQVQLNAHQPADADTHWFLVRTGRQTLSKAKWGAGIGTVAALVAIGGLAWLNPDQQAFETYAEEQLSLYLEDNLCRELAPQLEQWLNVSCRDLLAQNQALLDTVVRDRTQRYNFILFSVYRSTLALPSFGLLPTYQIDTLGILGQFYVVQAKQL
jgi:hypothetical protein